MTTMADPHGIVPPGSVQDEGPAASPGSSAGGFGAIALIAIAPAATVYLSFSNGGYFPNAVGVTAICLCAAFVLRVTLADRPFEGYNRVAALAIVGLSLFALVQLLSMSWSHTPAPALDDYDRTFLYVLVLALFASLRRSTVRVSWLTRSIAAGVSAVCVIGLITRVLPHVWPTILPVLPGRLSYPLGYSNALGLMAAVGCILLLHLTSSLREPWQVRVAAAALFPAVATTALLTYSRGGLAVAILGLVVYALLGGTRGLISGLIATAPTSVLALRSGYDAVLLSGNDPTSGAAVVQGRHVALTVGIAMLIAASLRIAGLAVDRWLQRPHRTLSALSVIPRWAAGAVGAAVVVVALLLAGAAGFVSREYHRFAGTGPQLAQTRDRLTELAGSGRTEFWRVALRQFSQHELLGQGAGTYRTYYAQHRAIDLTVTDAHSVYLQTLGEDGVVGAVLLAVALLAVIGGLVWRVRGPPRSLYAALFAAVLAWAVHNAVDWDWQMPAVTLWVFAVGGLALADRGAKEPRPASNLNRTALAACFLALAIAPLLIGFSYQRLRAGGVAFVDGNCALARQRALSSVSLLAIRPQAYEIVGYCDLQQSYPIEALAAMRKAVSYDAEDWEAHYAVAIALAANGRDPIPQAREALRLNPRESLVQDEVRLFQAAGPGGWAQASRAVMQEGLDSSALSVSNL